MGLISDFFSSDSTNDESTISEYLKNEFFLNGCIEYENANYSSALNYFNQGVVKFPSNPFMYYLRGISYFELKRFSEAIKDYEKYLLLHPNQHNGLFRLGRTYQETKDLRRASIYYEEAVKHYKPNVAQTALMKKFNPNYKGDYINVKLETILNNLGSVRGLMQDFHGAIESASKAIALNPNYPNAYYLRGVNHLQLNQINEAVNDLVKARDLGFQQAAAVLQMISGQ